MKKLTLWGLSLLLLASCSTGSEFKREDGAKFCREDVMTLCQGIAPGEGRISDCLREKRQSASANCRDFLNRFDGQFDKTFMPTMMICQEHEVICGHVKKYGARRINCLKQVYLETPEKLSLECRESFSKIIDKVPEVSR